MRVRPLNERESKSKNVLQLQSGETTAIDFGIKSQSSTANGEEITSSCSAEGTVSIDDQQGSSFTYDAVFGPESQQSEIFESVTELVDAVVSGYNGTIVAYGQTSSGKTHTIFGEESASSNSDEESAGLVQRSLKAIFEKMNASSSQQQQQQQHSAKASFFEIYNEKVYDLLSSNENMLQEPLAVREDSSARGVYVEGLMEYEVNNTVDAMDVLRVGNDNRRVASTSMNRVSSRSHAVFVLTVKNIITDEADGTSKVLESKFTLVDLAGSERQKTTDAAGERLKEASMINNSLLCLGQVINALVDREQGKERHVPFRDSKLTFLLKDSWGGNSKTCLVATVTPSASSISETISTLKFAQRAKLIKNTAVKNETYSVEALQMEIARLKSELEQRNNSSISRVESLPSMNGNDTVDGVVMTSLQNHNSTLNEKLKILKDRSNLMEHQVNSLKRKLQQETMIRKCKERRITFLSGKLKDDAVGKEVIENLQNELNILREQLDSKQNPESIHWMMKYKEEKIKLDQILTSNPTALEDVTQREALDEQVVALFQAKKSLEKQLASIQQCQRSEVDVMSNDVAKLEKQILTLKSLLSKKEAEVSHYEAEIIATQSQISSLDKDRIEALEFLETVNSELVTEQKKVVELQSSVDRMSQMIEDKENCATDYEQKQAAQQNELDNVKAQLRSLQTDLDAAKEENCSLIKNLNTASNDLSAREDELARLKSESELALASFNVKQKEGAAMLDSLKAKLEEKGEQMESLLREKAELEESLKDISSQNEALMAVSEAFKNKEAEWQDRVDSLVDEITRTSMEKEQMNRMLIAAEEDLKRTIAVHEESITETAEAHNSALAQRDEALGLLQTEKEALQTKLDAADKGFHKQVEDLQNKITSIEDECDNVRLKEQNLLSTLDALTDGYDQLRIEKDGIEKELKENKKLLKKSKSMISELEGTNESKVSETEAAKGETDALKKKEQQLLSDLKVANESSSQLRLKNEEIQKELDETKALLEDRVTACCSKAVELDTMRDELLFAKEKEEQLTTELNSLNNASSQLELDKDAVEKDLIETKARLDNGALKMAELERISEAKANETEAAMKELKSKILQLEKENETAQAYKTQVADLIAENQSYRESIVTLQSSLSQCEAAKVELDQNAESEVSELQATLTSTNEAHAAEISDLKHALDTLKAELVAKDESAAVKVKEMEEFMGAIEKQHAEEIELLKNQVESLKTSESSKEEIYAVKLKEMEDLVASSRNEHTEEVERLNICIESLKIEVSEFESSNARKLAERDVLVKVMKEHHAAELEEMQKQSDAVKNNAVSRVEDTAKKLSEVESAMATMTAEMEKMRQAEAKMIQKETEMSSKLNDMESASNSLKAEYSDEIERLNNEVEALKTDAKNKEQISATKLSDMEAAASRLHNDHASEINHMMQQANAVKSEMLEKDQTSAVKVKEMEEMIQNLKAQYAEEIEKLKLEIVSLKAEALTNSVTTVEKLDEEETEDSVKETTFDDEDEDDFDEAMFLPNVEIQPEANDVEAISPVSPETVEPTNAPPGIAKRVDENSPLSPSMTPFKARRDMFATQANKNMVEEKTPLKKPPPRRSKRHASAKATQTPVERVTRRSARLSTSRAPFTDLQDASISSTSTRKVRTNFKKGAFD